MLLEVLQQMVESFPSRSPMYLTLHLRRCYSREGVFFLSKDTFYFLFFDELDKLSQVSGGRR